MTIDKSLGVQRIVSPVRTQVLDNLRQAILIRQFKPGQRLIERELVEATGVSRTSVREVLRELGAEGLVTTIPNKGTVVTEVTHDEARDAEAVARACSMHVEQAGQAGLEALEASPRRQPGTD